MSHQPRELQKPLQNLPKNLSKSKPQKVEFGYIYSILEQPGLTLEREARSIVETILR